VCRYLYRVPLLLVHIIVFLPLILIGMLRPWGELRVGEATFGAKVVNWWQGGLMWIFGFRLVQIGSRCPVPCCSSPTTSAGSTSASCTASA
jgi:1-acyl-sn-glycerol-3-phosphate acyltransferase